MPDPLLQQARAAHERMDLSRFEYGFETRLAAALSRLERPATPVDQLMLWWKSATVLAAGMGIVIFFFIAGRGRVEAEDALAAWASQGSRPWNAQLFSPL